MRRVHRTVAAMATKPTPSKQSPKDEALTGLYNALTSMIETITTAIDREYIQTRGGETAERAEPAEPAEPKSGLVHQSNRVGNPPAKKAPAKKAPAKKAPAKKAASGSEDPGAMTSQRILATIPKIAAEGHDTSEVGDLIRSYGVSNLSEMDAEQLEDLASKIEEKYGIEA